ncbi:cytochrome-c peroxidase [Lewinellaceae bacterium SD302]|nr:cytochrome-c peroxidase [Lewinellaceae bacterium SD302]
MRNASVLLCLIAIFILGCGQDEPVTPQDLFAFNQPEHFPPPAYDLENDPITRAGVELGIKLFNDPRLSADRSVACSNCHAQAVAFADPQHRLSQGVNDATGTRNAPQITNLVFMSEFFWDGGVSHLDFVPINALESPVEMGNTLAEAVDFLQSDSDYPALFRAAFGTDTITSGLMLKAFSQFTNLLVSDRSKYDDVVLGRNNASFTADELAGKQLFDQHCSSCHTPPLFTSQGYANNGLDSTFTDEGRAAISGNPLDLGKFRIPSLRNVARTAPYMHDGRMATLPATLQHYNDGIIQSPTLAPELQSGIPLTPTEQEQIIDFLNTLTDWEFMSDERFN